MITKPKKHKRLQASDIKFEFCYCFKRHTKIIYEALLSRRFFCSLLLYFNMNSSFDTVLCAILD